MIYMNTKNCLKPISASLYAFKNTCSLITRSILLIIVNIFKLLYKIWVDNIYSADKFHVCESTFKAQQVFKTSRDN